MKKQIPLVILESLEPYVNLNGENFEVLPPDNYLIKIIDKDPNSDFYFNIKEYKSSKNQNRQNKFQILLDYKPNSKEIVENREVWIDIDKLNTFFDHWTKILDDYNKVKTFFDDPILKSYEEEYYAEFELLDEDERTPLKPKQILLLDNYLEFVETNLHRFENETNSKQIQEIKNEVIILRNNLTSKTKAWIVKKISKIWAKITKQGTSLFKEFIVEGRKQLIQKGIKFLLENGSDFF